MSRPGKDGLVRHRWSIAGGSSAWCWSPLRRRRCCSQPRVVQPMFGGEWKEEHALWLAEKKDAMTGPHHRGDCRGDDGGDGGGRSLELSPLSTTLPPPPSVKHFTFETSVTQGFTPLLTSDTTSSRSLIEFMLLNRFDISPQRGYQDVLATTQGRGCLFLCTHHNAQQDTAVAMWIALKRKRPSMFVVSERQHKQMSLFLEMIQRGNPPLVYITPGKAVPKLIHHLTKVGGDVYMFWEKFVVETPRRSLSVLAALCDVHAVNIPVNPHVNARVNEIKLNRTQNRMSVFAYIRLVCQSFAAQTIPFVIAPPLPPPRVLRFLRAPDVRCAETLLATFVAEEADVEEKEDGAPPSYPPVSSTATADA